jgi:hypothetical protein
VARTFSAQLVTFGFLLIAIAGGFTTTACKRRSSRNSDASKQTGSLFVSSILQRLRSPDEATRKTALEELSGQASKFSPAVAIELLEATTGEFPVTSERPWDTATSIVVAVGQKPRREYVPVIEKLFPRWKSASVRTHALVLLSRFDNDEAAAAFMKLVRAHAGELESLPLWQLQLQPHHPSVFFPGLLELLGHDALVVDIALAALAFSEKGLLPADALAPHAAPLLAAYHRERDWLRSKQRGKGVDWMWEEDYQVHRERAGVLLRILASISGDGVTNELREATAFRDPMLVHDAVVGLLKHGNDVPPESLEAVAASAETRGSLYAQLTELGKAALFPRRYLTQDAFAESEMVQWLADADGMERVPDEIQLMKVVSSDPGGPDGMLDYYLFRFRTLEPHEMAKEGWMAGVAGPFARKNAPTGDALDGTYSEFERWDAKTLEKHVEATRASLQEWAPKEANGSGDPWQ